LIYRRTDESDADTSQVLFSKEVGEGIIKVAEINIRKRL
jgi:hypothetical protein